MNDKIYMIARIYNQGELVGFTIFNKFTKETRNVTCQQLINAFNTGGVIENLEYVDGKFRGIGGSLSRYAAINTVGNLLSEPSLVVLGKGREYYILISFTGKEIYIEAENLYRLANAKIANGKLLRSEKSGYYLSAIEGSFDDDITKSTVTTDTSRKYHLPKIPSDKLNNNELDHAEYNYSSNLSAHLPKFVSYKWVDKKNILHREGLVHYKTRNNKNYVSAAFNDILVAYDPNYSGKAMLGVIGLKVGDEKYFYLSSLRNSPFSVMVQDILYIGKAWNSVMLTGSFKGGHNRTATDTKIIALGIVGLAVIWSISDEKTKELYKKGIEPEEKLINMICIPYCRISNHQALMNKLEKYGLLELLDNNDITRILNFARCCPYTFTDNINPLTIEAETFTSIPGVGIGEDKYEEFLRDNCLDRIDRMAVRSIEDIQFDSHSDFSVPDYLREAIKSEVCGSLGDSGYTVFNQFKSSEIIVPGSYVSISDNNGRKILYPCGLELKYIGYLQLYNDHKTSEMEQIPEAIISQQRRKGIKEACIWAKGYTGNNLIINAGRYRLVYNIPRIIEQYKLDISEYYASKEIANKVNIKMQMIGSGLKLDELGRIVDWKKGQIIEQNKKISGIKFTDSNESKRARVIVNDRFEIEDDRGITWKSVRLNLYISPNRLQLFREMLNIRTTHGICIGLDLNGASAESTLRALALILQINATSPNVVIGVDEDRKTVNLTQCKEIYPLSFLIKSASVLHNNRDSISFIFKNNPIINIEKMSLTERTAVIKEALRGYNKKSKGAKAKSSETIELIIKEFCTPDEVADVLNGFHKWAGIS